MQYWPTSWFLSSPTLLEQGKSELQTTANDGVMMSPVTMQACFEIAAHTVPIEEPLVFMISEGITRRRVFVSMPSTEERHAIERSGFYLDCGNFGFSLDALH